MGESEYDVPSIAEAKPNAKKKTLRSSQCATERVQGLRQEYWKQVQQVDPENLVFWDEMGVLLGLTRTHGRSLEGSRVYDLRPFYRGAKVTVVGAISLNQVVALMTLNGSMDSNANESVCATVSSASTLVWGSRGDGQPSCSQRYQD